MMKAIYLVRNTVLILLLFIIGGHESWVVAGEQQTLTALDQFKQMPIEDQIIHLVAIGLPGIVAVLGVIAFIRAIRTLFYMEKWQGFALSIGLSSIVGPACQYALMDFVNQITNIGYTDKSIVSAAIITPIAVMLTYDGLKGLLAYGYSKTNAPIFKALYFWLSPRPLKVRNDGAVIQQDPESSLTRFMNNETDDTQ